MIGNSTPAWSTLSVGAAGTVPTSNGTDVAYRSSPGGILCRYYESLTKTNIGTAYADIYTTGTAFHQTRLNVADYANVTEVRFVWIWDYVGTGNQQVRWVDAADNSKVLYESALFSADQDPADSGWVTKGAAFTGVHFVEWQGKSSVAGDDPIPKGYVIFGR